MVGRLRNADFSTVMGSWPYAPRPSGSGDEPVLLSGVLKSHASILGVRREPSAGFVLAANRAFNVKVDALAQFQVSIDAATYTLDQIITEINTDSQSAHGIDIAHRSGDFLLLRSPNPGEGSYIKIWSEPANEDIMDELGLFSGTESYAGELNQANHMDPTRQVALPGQASMLWGENFDANTFNRMAMQLALNSDRSTALLERKRVAVSGFEDITPITVQTVSSGPNVGEKFFQLTAGTMVFTGPNSTPTTAQLEEEIAVLDANGNEIIKEKEVVLASRTDAQISFSYDTDTGEQHVTETTASLFSSTDPEGEYYVILRNLGGGPAVLNDRQLKIVRYIDAGDVVVQAVDADGNNIVIADGDKTGTTTLDRVRVDTLKVRVSGFYKEDTLENRVEQVQTTLAGPALTVTRVEKGNRIYCDSADFSASTPPVAVGDIVVWSNSITTEPFSNDGTYRVAAVVDAKTLELVDDEYGPVVLNPVGVSYGDIEVKTDGEFWEDPYIMFDDKDVVPSGNVRVAFKAVNNLKEALTGDVSALAPSVKFLQEADAQMQKAILGIVGPSYNTFDAAMAWLYGDRRNSLEGALQMFGHEHHGFDTSHGRHSDIRPDTIDMYPEVAGTTITARVASGDSAGVDKIVLRDASDTDTLFRVQADGSVGIGDLADSPLYDLYVYKSAGDSTITAYAVGAGRFAELNLWTDDGYAQLYISAFGTSNFARVAWETSDSYFEVIAWQGHDTLYLRSGTYNYIWSAHEPTGYLGVGIEVPDTKLHVKARGDSFEDLVKLQGWSGSQTAIRMLFDADADGTNEAEIESYALGLNRYFRLKALGIVEFWTNNLKRWEIYSSNGDLVPSAAEGIGGGSIGTTQLEYIYTASVRTATNQDLEFKIGGSATQWLMQSASLGGKLLTPTNRQIGDASSNYVSAMYAQYYGGPSAQDVTYSSAQALIFKTGSIFGTTRWTIRSSDGALVQGTATLGAEDDRIDEAYITDFHYVAAGPVMTIETAKVNVFNTLAVGNDGVTGGDDPIVLTHPSGTESYIYFNQAQHHYLKYQYGAADEATWWFSRGTGGAAANDFLSIKDDGSNRYIRPEGGAVNNMDLGTTSNRFRHLYCDDRAIADFHVGQNTGQAPGSTTEAGSFTQMNNVYARGKVRWTGSTVDWSGYEHWNISFVQRTAVGVYYIVLDYEPHWNAVVLGGGDGNLDGPVQVVGSVTQIDTGDGNGLIYRVKIETYAPSGTGGWTPTDSSFFFAVIGSGLVKA